ncbi:MAG TPA: hypothetical protein VHC69_09435 [Polyangiaceae bacterium]|nr:hypothetical protein [Polyangiaceae bacterium]
MAYPFVLDALDEHEPTTRPLFGSTAVYLGERVLFILRKKGDSDDGVWVAFDEDREADALAALPNLAKITRLPNVRCWRKLAESSADFEDDVLEACRLATAPQGPLGKIPIRQKAKRSKESKKKPARRAEKPRSIVRAPPRRSR